MSYRQYRSPKDFSGGELLIFLVAFIVIAAALYATTALLVMVAWNSFGAEVFDARAISYGEALILTFVTSFIIKVLK